MTGPEESALDQARRHVMQAKESVTRQEEIVERMIEQGASPERLRDALSALGEFRHYLALTCGLLRYELKQAAPAGHFNGLSRNARQLTAGPIRSKSGEPVAYSGVGHGQPNRRRGAGEPC